MPSLEYLLPFFVATVLFAYMPGPALLYTAAQTLARGRKAGFMAALGLHLGGYVHVTAAALGLSAIFTHVPELYTLVKLLGAGYLVWLGICFIRQKDTVEQLPQVKARRVGRAFLQSITVEVLNPKTVIFFIAFLPQFADASAETQNDRDDTQRRLVVLKHLDDHHDQTDERDDADSTQQK